jgi:hypothetical protein
MIVILRALGGLLESEPRSVPNFYGKFYVPFLVSDYNLGPVDPSNLSPSVVCTAVFEDHGGFKKVGENLVTVLDLVEFRRNSS